MQRKKRVAKKKAIKKVRTTHNKMDESQQEDWNQVESKLFNSLSEKEAEPCKNNSSEIEEQVNPSNEWQEDWLFGDMDRSPEANDIDPNRKNPL